MGDEQCRIRLVVGLDFDDGWGANVNLLLRLFVCDCQVKDHCCSTTQPQRNHKCTSNQPRAKMAHNQSIKRALSSDRIPINF